MNYKGDAVLIQDYAEKHRGFVIDTWIKSYRAADAVKGISREVYWNNQDQVIINCLEKANTKVLVTAEDPDLFLGYVCYTPTLDEPVIHYIYMKESFRGKHYPHSFAPLLLEQAGWKGGDLVSTHYLNNRHKYKDTINIVYNPYLLYRL